MGFAALAFLAFSIVVAVYLWKSTPSASRADERRRWWSFTHGADANPFFGPRDQPGPGGGEDVDGRGGFGGGSGPYGY